MRRCFTPHDTRRGGGVSPRLLTRTLRPRASDDAEGSNASATLLLSSAVIHPDLQYIVGGRADDRHHACRAVTRVSEDIDAYRGFGAWKQERSSISLRRRVGGRCRWLARIAAPPLTRLRCCGGYDREASLAKGPAGGLA